MVWLAFVNKTHGLNKPNAKNPNIAFIKNI